MSMFPGPGAVVYYNDAGEPLGWDYPGSDNDPYLDDDPYMDYGDYFDYDGEFDLDEDEDPFP